ncbi:uncharacterized protein BJ171DRAFT_193468, partial [Polychytrium aggregatum]|uniref:uncharacterized protein n=1 Tax=Polychytrium aggregatum TaxID=110093 RepID=UPI0022FE460A
FSSRPSSLADAPPYSFFWLPVSSESVLPSLHLIICPHSPPRLHRISNCSSTPHSCLHFSFSLHPVRPIACFCHRFLDRSIESCSCRSRPRPSPVLPTSHPGIAFFPRTIHAHLKYHPLPPALFLKLEPSASNLLPLKSSSYLSTISLPSPSPPRSTFASSPFPTIAMSWKPYTGLSDSFHSVATEPYPSLWSYQSPPKTTDPLMLQHQHSAQLKDMSSAHLHSGRFVQPFAGSAQGSLDRPLAQANPAATTSTPAASAVPSLSHRLSFSKSSHVLHPTIIPNLAPPGSSPSQSSSIGPNPHLTPRTSSSSLHALAFDDLSYSYPLQSYASAYGPVRRSSNSHIPSAQSLSSTYLPADPAVHDPRSGGALEASSSPSTRRGSVSLFNATTLPANTLSSLTTIAATTPSSTTTTTSVPVASMASVAASQWTLAEPLDPPSQPSMASNPRSAHALAPSATNTITITTSDSIIRPSAVPASIHQQPAIPEAADAAGPRRGSLQTQPKHVRVARRLRQDMLGYYSSLGVTRAWVPVAGSLALSESSPWVSVRMDPVETEVCDPFALSFPFEPVPTDIPPRPSAPNPSRPTPFPPVNSVIEELSLSSRRQTPQIPEQSHEERSLQNAHSGSSLMTLMDPELELELGGDPQDSSAKSFASSPDKSLGPKGIQLPRSMASVVAASVRPSADSIVPASATLAPPNQRLMNVHPVSVPRPAAGMVAAPSAAAVAASVAAPAAVAALAPLPQRSDEIDIIVSGAALPAKPISVFVSFLPLTVSERDVYKLFRLHGSILEIRMVPNKREDAQFAFVDFDRPESAQQAMLTLQGERHFDMSKNLHLEFASRKQKDVSKSLAKKTERYRVWDRELGYEPAH